MICRRRRRSVTVGRLRAGADGVPAVAGGAEPAAAGGAEPAAAGGAELGVALGLVRRRRTRTAQPGPTSQKVARTS